ncbi:hypothetical protein CK203_095632 [Vitis vinifera]|uniref:Uncharacterized protein n=1 Tax=Vitis vinifera TaxID=29760 RepID=A0A438EMH8_VITVI|nr:hypothetical protein CK203_095632 [Vitis vinifera]
MYMAVSEWAISAVLFRCPTQGAETYLLRQQSVGGRRNQIIHERQVMTDFVLEYSKGLANARNQMKKNGGLCGSMEPHDHQGPESGFCYSPQQGNIWSKLSGWDSLPLKMKQNMRSSIRIESRSGSIRLQAQDL